MKTQVLSFLVYWAPKWAPALPLPAHRFAEKCVISRGSCITDIAAPGSEPGGRVPSDEVTMLELFVFIARRVAEVVGLLIGDSNVRAGQKAEKR